MAFIIHIFDKEIDSYCWLNNKEVGYILIGFEGIVDEPWDDTGFAGTWVTEENDFILFFRADTDSFTAMADGFMMSWWVVHFFLLY